MATYYAGKRFLIINPDIQDIEEVEVYIEINSSEIQLDNYAVPYVDSSTSEGAVRISSFSYVATIPLDAEIDDAVRFRFKDVYSEEEFYFPSSDRISYGVFREICT